MATELIPSLIQTVLSTGLSFFLGLFAPNLYQRYAQTRPARSVLGFKENEDVYFITARPPSYAPEEYTVTVYPAEYSAVAELSNSFLSIFGKLKLHTYTADNFPADKIEEHVVVIGGPVHNQWANVLMNKIETPIVFEGHQAVDKHANNRYSSEIVESRIVRDYAIVLGSQNPFNRSKRALLLAGCRTYGCHAAAKSLTFPTLLEIKKRLGRDENFAMIIESSVISHYVGIPRIVCFRKM